MNVRMVQKVRKGVMSTMSLQKAVRELEERIHSLESRRP